ncbi:MAG: hypothetical protein J0I06_27075 [Planctomycetes bacterium]|nr:hypothetical protein [Planctomycetota bacterium]
MRILRLRTPKSHGRAPLLGVEALEDRAVPATAPLLKPGAFDPAPVAVFRSAEPFPPPAPGALPAIEKPGGRPLGSFVELGSTNDSPRPPRELVAQFRQFADRPFMITLAPLRSLLTRGFFGPAVGPSESRPRADFVDEGEPAGPSAAPSAPPVPPLVLVSAVRGEGYFHGALAPDDVGASRAEPAPAGSNEGSTTHSPEAAPAVAPTVAAVDPTRADEPFTNILPFAPLRELARDAWERVGAALPELGSPGDAVGDDAVPELWQVGVCLVTGAAVWAVVPGRDRTRLAPHSAGAARSEVGEWSERGANR